MQIFLTVKVRHSLCIILHVLLLFHGLLLDLGIRSRLLVGTVVAGGILHIDLSLISLHLKLV